MTDNERSRIYIGIFFARDLSEIIVTRVVRVKTHGNLGWKSPCARLARGERGYAGEIARQHFCWSTFCRPSGIGGAGFPARSHEFTMTRTHRIRMLRNHQLCSPSLSPRHGSSPNFSSFSLLQALLFLLVFCLSLLALIRSHNPAWVDSIVSVLSTRWSKVESKKRPTTNQHCMIVFS